MSIKEIVKKIPGARPAVRAARKAVDRFVENYAGDRLLPFHPTYNSDNLATGQWFVTDDAFEAAYQGAVNKGLLMVRDDIRWRSHVLCWAGAVGKKLGGAFIECGVARGFQSRVVMDYLGIEAPFYLLDTYKGFDRRFLSEKQAAGLDAWEKEHGGPYYQDSYDQVVKTFSDKPNVRIIRGAVPETLAQVDADRIAYLALDMNSPIPELAAIDYFWPKLVPGAFVILDDYGWHGHDEQRLGFIDWSRRTGNPILSLPTGQGLIVKT